MQEHVETDTQNHLSQAIEKLEKQDDKINKLLQKMQPKLYPKEKLCVYTSIVIIMAIMAQYLPQHSDLIAYQQKELALYKIQLSQKSDQIAEQQKELTSYSTQLSQHNLHRIHQKYLLESQEHNMEVLSHKFDYMHSLKEKGLNPNPFTHTIKDFKISFLFSKQNDNGIRSEPFYCLDGYRARLAINLNVNGGESERIKGPFDDALDWPFKGIVTLSVQGKINDDIKMTLDTTKVPQDIIENCFQKPTTVREGYGFLEFLSHDLIDKYVMDNTLKITCAVRPAK